MVAAGFAPWRVHPHQVRPHIDSTWSSSHQPDQVTYRDYSSFFYPLRYKIAGGEKTSKSWGQIRNIKFIVGADLVEAN